MALLHIPLDDITKDDLRALIESGARESLYIDYKCKTYGGSDARQKEGAKKEFRKDICSFANAAGGDIIIGMAEDDEAAAKLMPLNGDIGKEISRLEQIAQHQIEPRIGGLRMVIPPISVGARSRATRPWPAATRAEGAALRGG